MSLLRTAMRINPALSFRNYTIVKPNAILMQRAFAIDGADLLMLGSPGAILRSPAKQASTMARATLSAAEAPNTMSTAARNAADAARYREVSKGVQPTL